MDAVKKQMDIAKSREETPQERIGKRIAELRKMKGISQAKLASLTGLDSGYIGRLEKGKFDVGLVNLSKIGEALGVDLDFISR